MLFVQYFHEEIRRYCGLLVRVRVSKALVASFACCATSSHFPMYLLFSFFHDGRGSPESEERLFKEAVHDLGPSPTNLTQKILSSRILSRMSLTLIRRRPHLKPRRHLGARPLPPAPVGPLKVQVVTTMTTTRRKRRKKMTMMTKTLTTTRTRTAMLTFVYFDLVSTSWGLGSS
jgi:hypothetical protein